MKKRTALTTDKQSILGGVVFVVLFVLQQSISFVWESFNLVTPYWLLFTLVILYITVKNWGGIFQYKDAAIFAVVLVVSSFFALMNGTTIGGSVVKALCPWIGFLGYYYLTKHRINLIVFDVLLGLAYLFFSTVYFSLDIAYRESSNGDLFGHSSSNTIAIVLNCFWIIYYIVAKSYGRSEKQIMLLVFSVLNLFYIVIQGSRMGIAVAAINIILAVSDVMKIKKQLVPFLLGFGVYLFTIGGDFLENYIEYRAMQGVEAYYENVRSMAQKEFFDKLSFESILFGFPSTMEFAGHDRTFNAFLDFWRNYGIVPLVFFIFFLIVRIVKQKHYYVPLIAFVSILLYSFVETIWGKTLWDVIIFLILFYSNEKTFTFNEDEAKKAS